MGVTQLSIVADSLSAGTVSGYARFQGGAGTWADYVTERLAATLGLGQVISPGVRFVGESLNYLASNEWAFTAGGNTIGFNATNWSNANGQAWGILPYQWGIYGSGSGLITTYTLSSYYKPVVGFDIWWVDMAGGGNWSYRIDGGAWTAMGQTRNQNNTLCKFYVASSMTSTLEIRAADSAGTSVSCCPGGITPYFVDPRSATTGFLVNNYAINGMTLDSFIPTMACLDSVVLGTGSPISSKPTLGTLMMHINDVQASGVVATWRTDVNYLYNRLVGSAPVLFMSPYECNTAPTFYDSTTQATYRAATKQTLAILKDPKKPLDLYDVYTQMGITGNAAMQSLGYTVDNTHQTVRGHFHQQEKIYWFIRNNLFNCRTSNQFRMGQSRMGATSRLGGATSLIAPDASINAIGGGTGTGKKSLKSGSGVSTSGTAC